MTSAHLRLSFLITAVFIPRPCMAQASVLAHYELNGNAVDSSGFGNDGTVMGATTTLDRFGAPNSAYFFDGVDDYIDIPESTAFDSSPFSISLWFRAASFPAEAGMLISKGQNNFEIHTAAIEFTGQSAMKFLPRFVDHGVTMDWHTPADTYGLDEWTHVVAAYDPGNAIRFYINAIEIPLTGPASLLDAPDNLLNARLGARTDNMLYFHGDIDDVRIYNQVLTANEVGQIYAAVPEPSSIVVFAVTGLLFAAVPLRRFGRAVSAV